MASTRVFNATKTLFAAAKSTTTTTTTAAAKKKKPTVKKPTEKTVKAAVGILKPSPISPALAQFLGVNESARTDAVKKIWEHIKLNQLQTEAAVQTLSEIYTDTVLEARLCGAKASLRREAWPPRYEMDQGVDSRRGVR
ncbi:upstream activation factor subunit spp27-like protein [Tanacetum coccineum]